MSAHLFLCIPRVLKSAFAVVIACVITDALGFFEIHYRQPAVHFLFRLEAQHDQPVAEQDYSKETCRRQTRQPGTTAVHHTKKANQPYPYVPRGGFQPVCPWVVLTCCLISGKRAPYICDCLQLKDFNRFLEVTCYIGKDTDTFLPVSHF